jgi:hypothetical protein
MADLYGDQRAIGADREALAALGRLAYVLFRKADYAGARAAWAALGAHAGFERVYDAGGFVVYHVSPPRPSAGPETDR